MNQYFEKSDKTIKRNSNCERFAMNQISNRSKIDWRYNSMKSLILAQDERWRHA